MPVSRSLEKKTAKMSKNGTWRALKILECFEDLE
jgi:hypothetical protein